MSAAVVRRSAGRRLADRLHGRKKTQLGLLLAGPLGWLGLAYLGSLAVLLVASFWRLDPFTSQVVHEYGTQNFRTIIEGSTYRSRRSRPVVADAEQVQPAGSPDSPSDRWRRGEAHVSSRQAS